MPTSKQRKKRNKQYKPKVVEIDFKELDGKKQWELLRGSNKLPKCKICGADTEFASNEDVKAYKNYDASYQYNFIIAPTCQCYLEHELWME